MHYILTRALIGLVSHKTDETQGFSKCLYRSRQHFSQPFVIKTRTYEFRTPWHYNKTRLLKLKHIRHINP